MKIKIAEHLIKYTIKQIAEVTRIDYNRVEAILNAQKRPRGIEMVTLCSLAGIDPFDYERDYGQYDFDLWVENRK